MPLFQQPFMSGGFPSMNRVVAATEFTSMYESFNPLTTVNKQHFVEWFSGSALDSIWTTFDAVASAVEAMSDSVDGGFEIQHSTTNNSWNGIAFNNIRQYNYNGSVIITVGKKNFGAGAGGTHFGLGGTLDTTQDQTAECTADTAVNANFSLQTDATSSATTTAGSTAIDESWHSQKVETKASSVEMTLDGTLEATSTTNLPNSKLQPKLFGIKRSTDAGDITQIRYCEAYNT